SPYRCGLIVLLSWQIVPVIILLCHSLTLYSFFFIFFLPGPCILVGIFLTKTAEWLRNGKSITISRHALRYGVYALATLIIVAQFISSIAQILDYTNGKYSDGFDHGFAYNDSLSLQNALAEADQLAQRHHLNQVYISI